MLDFILSRTTGKRIVVYNRHRQSEPLVMDKRNRKRFIFIEASGFWKRIPFKSTNKNKYRVMSLILMLLSPAVILDINWISPYQRFYRVWARKTGRRFVVLQHGSYIGGVITDRAHRFVHCDVLLTWGPYFTSLFSSVNSGKATKIVSFGNPVFNRLDRNAFRYRGNRNNTVLLAPSVVDQGRLPQWLAFYNYLTSRGYMVLLKEHKLQSKFGGPMREIPKTTENIYDVLLAQKYDLVITDHSSVLLDAIFFKNRCLLFSVPGDHKAFVDNQFTVFLPNLFDFFSGDGPLRDLYDFVDVDQQEMLFNNMVLCATNELGEL